MEGSVRQRPARAQGVRCTALPGLRPVDDPGGVTLDLEFDTEGEAKAFGAALRELWGRIDVIGENPLAQILDVVESEEL